MRAKVKAGSRFTPRSRYRPVTEEEIPRIHVESAVLMNKIGFTLVECLEGQHRSIMEKRLGIGMNKGMTLEAIGDFFEPVLSKERIRQIEDESFSFIRMACMNERLKKWKFPQTTYVADFGFDNKTVNALLESGILYVEMLCLRSAEELRMVARLGKKTIDGIEKKLAEHGLTLRKHEDEMDLTKCIPR